MQNQEAAVKEAIEKSIGIYQDAHFEDRQIYYFRLKTKPRYLKVVVQFDTEEIGNVITAFPADSAKSGEKMIWPISNS